MFGAIIGAVGALAAASSQRSAAKAEGEIAQKQAEYNAKIFENRAKSVEYAMQAQTQNLIRDQRRAQATQEASAAYMGARIDEGTPLNVMLEQVQEMALDVNNLRRNRMIEAAHERAGKSMTLYQGENAVYLAKQKARAYRQAGVMSAMGSIASGIKFGKFNFDGTPSYTDSVKAMGELDSLQGSTDYAV
jgi:hypothetical protein